MKKKIINFLNKVLKRYWLQIISNDYRYCKYWVKQNISKTELEVLSWIWINYFKNRIEENLINRIKQDLLISSITNMYQKDIDTMSISKEIELYFKVK